MGIGGKEAGKEMIEKEVGGRMRLGRREFRIEDGKDVRKTM